MTNAGDIVVEVVPPPGEAGDLSPSQLVEQASSRMGELGGALATVAEDLRETLDRRLAGEADGWWPLTSLSLQLSINLEAEAGIVISRARTGAAFQATLTWSRRDPSPPSAGM